MMMNFHSAFLFLLIIAFAIDPCMADSEFGRAAIEDTIDMEDALRELVVIYDMSMSVSYSYDYDSHDEGMDSGDDAGDNGSNDEGYNATQPTTPSSPSAVVPDEPTLAPSKSVPAGSSNSSLTDPAADLPTVAPTAAPEQLPSCFGLPSATFQSPLFVETDKDSISFAVLEDALTDAMRDVLPFCEDLGQRKLEQDAMEFGQRKLEDAVESSGDSDYFIGNVDLVADELGATCEPKVEGNNCFVAELTLKLFGNFTEETVEYILEVVEGLLETDVEEALGVENSLIDDVNVNSTETDADQGGASNQESRNTGGMSDGRKVMISLLTIAVVAFIAVFAYRHYNKPTNVIPDDNESQESDDYQQGALGMGSDRERLYGA